MKAKNTKELKEKIEAEAKAEFDFEQHLFKKYPDLFHTGEDGQLLPQFQRCWNDCPKGWETLVDNLFDSIDQYIKHTTKTEENPDKKIKTWVHKNIWRKIHARLDIIFNPYKRVDYTVRQTEEQKQKMNKSFAMKVRRIAMTIQAWFISEMYIYVKPRQVKVAQYKEKFGTLRVYIDSGDKTINGMIYFAEYLSSKTCQDSGEAGNMCRRGGWYATLAPSEAEKQGYTKAET